LRFLEKRFSTESDGFMHFLVIEREIFLMYEESDIGLMFGGKDTFMGAIDEDL